MPPPIPVVLEPYDPIWPALAKQEATRLVDAIGDGLAAVHHVGSTAICGIRAKPILDLLPVFDALTAMEHARYAIESLGYEWWGEYGLPGRRYCTLDDTATGRRRAQLHCYVDGSPEIERHLAFRDYLRARADVASAYDAEKARCRDVHPLDSHAYSVSKSEWICRVEAEALEFYRRAGRLKFRNP